MNWINLTFYTAIAITGACYALVKIRPMARAMPQVLLAITIWLAELFWVISIIFLLRSLVWEPFRIPSASMMPTLEANDFIVVNKYEYGMKLPGINVALTTGQAPKRGDVVVFRYPPEPSQDYIKRLVGLPGDILRYQSRTRLEGERLVREKSLMINGTEVGKTSVNATPSLDPEGQGSYVFFTENLGDKAHAIRERIDFAVMNGWPNFSQFAQNCRFALPDVFECTVPQGHYFVMGDNRDESADSRYWGFVPHENLVGRAFWIWMNTWKFERIGAIQ